MVRYNNLFTTIADFKKYVGGGANMSVQMASLEPIIHDAARDHVAPYLGEGFLDILEAHITGTSVLNADVLEVIKRPIALLTLHEYSKIGGVQLSEIGIMRSTTETMQTAFKYQEHEYRQYMLMKGYEALEELLKYLMFVKPYWWVNDTGYERHTELFVRYASDMKRHYGMDISRYSYEILRGILKETQMYSIEAELPRLLVAQLHSVQDLNETTTVGLPTITPEEKKAIQLIQAALTHYAIEEGIRRQWVRLEGHSVVHTEGVNDQSSLTTKTGSAEAVSLKMRHHELWANRHLSRLKDHIWANKSAFPSAFTIAEGGVNTEGDAWATVIPEPITPEDKKKTRIFSF
jgi:hypothetical protein